jgi:hypothetical protein
LFRKGLRDESKSQGDCWKANGERVRRETISGQSGHSGQPPPEKLSLAHGADECGAMERLQQKAAAMNRPADSFRCPTPPRRNPADRPVEWFTHGYGSTRWAALAEAARIEGVTPSSTARRARAGCPYSVRIGGRVFIRRACLDEEPPCADHAYWDPSEPTPAERAAAKAKRQAEKERTRLEWAERRAAHERHAARVKRRQILFAELKARWKASGAPWSVWLAQKKEFKSAWEATEAREIGRDALRLAGKPLAGPEAELEALRLGWREIALRYGNRLCRRGCR